MNTRRRRLQRMRRRHRGWKYAPVALHVDASDLRWCLETRVNDRTGVRFVYTRDGKGRPRDQRYG